MRQLLPLKAVAHALKSVVDYRSTAVRFGLFWIPLLFVLGLAELLIGVPPPGQPDFGPGKGIELISAAIGLVGVCAMAVGWHRFILRDEMRSPTRLDWQVWRYLGNSVLIMLIVLVPLIIIAVVLNFLPPVLSILLLPASLIAAVVAIRLSIKLPAVAVGRTDFSFADAWTASAGQFWPLAGVVVLNAAIVIGAALLLMSTLWGVDAISPAAAPFVALVIISVLQLFGTMFNAGILTSLYGFFVEKRDY